MVGERERKEFWRQEAEGIGKGRVVLGCLVKREKKIRQGKTDGGFVDLRDWTYK